VGQLAERDPGAARTSPMASNAGGSPTGGPGADAGARASVSPAHPAALATSTMALLQGGLLLTQVRRDPEQLRTALAAARVLLRAAAA